MADTMTTYHSVNSKPENQWLGFLNFEGTRLPITFFAPTEAEAKAKMKEFYAKDKAKRDANRAQREANKAAAAERAAKKKEAA